MNADVEWARSDKCPFENCDLYKLTEIIERHKIYRDCKVIIPYSKGFKSLMTEDTISVRQLSDYIYSFAHTIYTHTHTHLYRVSSLSSKLN